MLTIGAWRSLVARFNGVEEAVGSNPAAPTSILVCLKNAKLSALKKRAVLRGSLTGG